MAFRYTRDPSTGQPMPGPAPHPAFGPGGPSPYRGPSRYIEPQDDIIPGNVISYTPQPNPYAIAVAEQEAAMHREMALRAPYFPPPGPLQPPPGLPAIDGFTGQPLRGAGHPSMLPSQHPSMEPSHHPTHHPSAPAAAYPAPALRPSALHARAATLTAEAREERARSRAYRAEMSRREEEASHRQTLLQRAVTNRRSRQPAELYGGSVPVRTPAEAMMEVQRAAETQRSRQAAEAVERCAAAAAAAAAAASRHGGSRHSASGHGGSRREEGGARHAGRSGRHAASSRVGERSLARRRMERAMEAERHPYARG